MEKRWINGLLVAITVALLGLMAIQVKWMRDTMGLREAQFQRSVDNAMFAVSDRLEQLERMHVLKGHKVGRRLLHSLEAMRKSSEQRSMEHEELAIMERMEGGEVEQGPGRFEAGHVPPVPYDPTSNVMQEELIADMVRGILGAELSKDIRERIDPRVLDSLLMDEFVANGIDGEIRFGVFNDQDQFLDLGTGEPGVPPVRLDTPHREKLFRHDLVGPSYFLLVEVPGHRQVLWKGMLPMLITSVLLMTMIVLAFVHTIRTIYRQKRIGEIRTDLVNNLTHELKTPISTIGLACEALSDPSMPKTEQQVRTFVGMIRDENKRLGSLVENVLQSAVLEGGHMVLKRVDLDLHAVIADVVRSSSMQVSRRNGRIDLDLGAEIHHVNGDRIHLTNLLYNLIDNAVKYAEQEPKVRISTASDNEGVTVAVMDNGIGIAASEQHKIFDRLYRVPTGNIHNAKGFGLGLSYVRTVVERHGGRIRVESIPGKGSTFHIYIPFEHVTTAETAVGRR